MRQSSPYNERLAMFGLVALFPGFFFYHLLVATGAIPPVLGGLFGVVSALLFTLFVLKLPVDMVSLLRRSPSYMLLIFVLFAYCFTWVLLHYVFVSEGYIEEAALQAMESLVVWVSLFFVGVHLPYESAQFRRLIEISFIAIAGFLVFFVIDTGRVMFYARAFYDIEESLPVVSYQGFALSALVVSVFMLSISRTVVAASGVVALSVFSLFILGARSEFYAYLLLLSMLLLVYSFKYVKWFAVSVLVVVVVGAAVIIHFDTMIASRQLEVLDLSQSRSWSIRQQVESLAATQIAESPVMGFFGGAVAATGGRGNYAHNALSAWVTYGLVGFLLFILAIALAAFKSFWYLTTRPRADAWWSASFAINFISMVLVLIAKSVFWPLPALGWGLFVNAAWHERRRRIELQGGSE